ncbi:hypothetical protein ACJJI4_01400 [Microbulbifer sp. TRSA002]|uniref:hypothetical protein n=1 Tax=Microbulbifer sp. TRSA002 TaxID=3243382 RepID=UPI004039464B
MHGDRFEVSAKDKLLTALGNQTPTPVQSYSVVVQEGEGIKRLKADVENAIAVRALGEKRTEGNELSGYTMMEIARILMQAHGQSLSGLDRMGVVAVEFTHSSGGFATVLGNIANKSMLKGCEEAQEIFPALPASATSVTLNSQPARTWAASPHFAEWLRGQNLNT